METAGENRKHLYGPVPSRRLGRSLGVDIVPYKVCSYDCIYCQLGRTTDLTTELRPYVSASRVMGEIEKWLKEGGTADFVTFAGSGEPTLNSDLGEMIGATKRLTDIPVAVITNGSLLGEPPVREAVSQADLLVPSLDAGTRETFEAVNRPAPGISFGGMVGGLVDTALQFHGRIWLEIMLVEGVNDSDAEIEAMREIVRHIWPERIHLNTVERPSRSGPAHAACPERLEAARKVLGDSAEVVMKETQAPDVRGQWRKIDDEMLELLSRRPCTVNDIASASGRNAHEVLKHLHRLTTRGLVEQTEDTDPYYRCVTGDQNAR